MNYYWWKSVRGTSGNVYANTSEEAIEKVVKGFSENVAEIELLKENVKRNWINGENYTE